MGRQGSEDGRDSCRVAFYCKCPWVSFSRPCCRLRAINGTHALALAAKHHSVPVRSLEKWTSSLEVFRNEEPPPPPPTLTPSSSPHARQIAFSHSQAHVLNLLDVKTPAHKTVGSPSRKVSIHYPFSCPIERFQRECFCPYLSVVFDGWFFLMSTLPHSCPNGYHLADGLSGSHSSRSWVSFCI